MNSRSWTEEEIEWLKENYFNNSIKFCVKYLDRPYTSIQGKAIKLGLGEKKKYINFTKEQEDWLIENYPKYGKKYCAEYLNISESSIKRQCKILNITSNKFWNEQEIQFLKDNYPNKGIKYCANFLKRGYGSVNYMTMKLNLNIIESWNKESIEFLKQNYPVYGSKICSEKLNKSEQSIRQKAYNLKIEFIGIKPLKPFHKICTVCKVEKPLKEFGKLEMGTYNVGGKCKNCFNVNYRKKVNNDPILKIKLNLRNRVWCVIKRENKSKHTLELIGCDIKFLKQYLESKFQEGMSWENYGGGDYSKQHWHIDHIKPCGSFDLTKLEEQLKCFHYTNLQPLWWRDNMSKGNNINWSKK